VVKKEAHITEALAVDNLSEYLHAEEPAMAELVEAEIPPHAKRPHGKEGRENLYNTHKKGGCDDSRRT